MTPPTPLADTVYRTSPLKRIRRTNTELAHLDNALVEIVAAQKPMTVRQVFYRAEVLGIVEKSEKGYSVVQRRLVALREARRIPWGSITDGTRWVHGGNTYSGVGAFMEEAAQVYRRDAWQQSNERVEVWLEKDALSGVLLPVADQWGIPLYVTRGFASLSYLQSAAAGASNDGRPVTILLLTDLDPSGIAIAEHVEAELTRRAPHVDISVERLAVNFHQVVDWNLPTRPTKAGDSRAARFIHEHGVACTELDAVEPSRLRGLVSDAVMVHKPQSFDQLQAIEAGERETLQKFAETWREAAS